MRDPQARTLSPPPVRFRTGVVASLGPLMVTVADGDIQCSWLHAYAPVVGDEVLILFRMGAGCVLGRIDSDDFPEDPP